MAVSALSPSAKTYLSAYYYTLKITLRTNSVMDQSIK
jgi:hypothetical protein